MHAGAARFAGFVAGALSIMFMLTANASQQATQPSSAAAKDATGKPARQTSGPYTITTIANGLQQPWSLAFLPDGNMLVTELPGRLRIIRNGVLDPTPIAGLPAIYAPPYAGLMDVVLHPDFANNQFVYLSYNKQGSRLADGIQPMAWRFYLGYSPGGVKNPEGERRTSTLAVARGRWNGTSLTEVREIFVADDWKDESIPATTAARMVFGRDGMLYVSIGGANAPASTGPYARSQGGVAQDPARHGGKVLRLRDDGTAPKDNPFVGRRGYKPEIYTMGHRNTIGLTMHPETGAIWEHENGPADGDEVNILKPGANYGWPLVGMGREYLGDFIGGPGAIGAPVGRKDASKMYMEGMEQPFIFWTPTVAPSGMVFYTGDRFANLKGNLLIGELKMRRVERIIFTERGGVARREYLFEDLKQRIRDVRQGPDGLIYLLTDATPGAVLRVERTP
jgi:aldose sugar dehydrogenase